MHRKWPDGQLEQGDLVTQRKSLGRKLRMKKCSGRRGQETEPTGSRPHTQLLDNTTGTRNPAAIILTSALGFPARKSAIEWVVILGTLQYSLISLRGKKAA